jgi:hypothetical protein
MNARHRALFHGNRPRANRAAAVLPFPRACASANPRQPTGGGNSSRPRVALAWSRTIFTTSNVNAITNITTMILSKLHHSRIDADVNNTAEVAGKIAPAGGRVDAPR